VSRQRLGQHFLTQGSILERIAHVVCPEREPLVIEIGPGRGTLTGRLLERADRVIAIEIDSELADFLREQFRDEPRLELIHADALETDLSRWGTAAVAGNLPYYAATHILKKTLALGASLRRAVFLVQKEVAARLAAKPGSRAYGYLSVHTQLMADVAAVFDVRPSAFRPPPKVDSTLVRLQPHDRATVLGLADPADYLAFVSLCFRQKRKTIRNNLLGTYGKDAFTGFPEAAQRAEELTIPQFAELYRRLVPS
jgi:16S rRNA (adenine1518-N6/adenine1519-N6)-dimethyltransferase